MKSLKKEKASWTTVYLGKPCKQESCSNLSEAIQDIKDMIDVLDFSGSAYVYRHNGGRKRLENILRCLYDFEETNINKEK